MPMILATTRTKSETMTRSTMNSTRRPRVERCPSHAAATRCITSMGADDTDGRRYPRHRAAVRPGIRLAPGAGLDLRCRRAGAGGHGAVDDAPGIGHAQPATDLGRPVLEGLVGLEEVLDLPQP